MLRVRKEFVLAPSRMRRDLHDGVGMAGHGHHSAPGAGLSDSRGPSGCSQSLGHSEATACTPTRQGLRPAIGGAALGCYVFAKESAMKKIVFTACVLLVIFAASVSNAATSPWKEK